VPWLPQSGLLAHLLAASARRGAARLARRFIAGTTLPEALTAVAALRRRRLAFTVDLLGEATVTEMEAESYQQAYLELLEGLDVVNTWPRDQRSDTDDRGNIPRVNVSVKLSSLFSQFDPLDPAGTSTAVRHRLRPILRTARRHGAFVNIDMEQHAFKDLTLQIFREVLMEDEFRDWSDVGIAIQTYLRDTEHDLTALLHFAEQRGTPMGVRLVKGAYWDFETVVAAQQGWPVPVFINKWETDANHERLTRFLLEHHTVLRPAIGSHNVRSLAHALAVAQLQGLPPGSFELQMLFGMAEPVKDALVSMGHRVRVYTPYGQLLPGMAYLVRRLLENTANESFLRVSSREHLPEEQLLMNPSLHANDHQPSTPAVTTTTTFRNESLADFSREDSRQSMRQALDEVARQLGRPYPAIIGGQPIAISTTFDSVNPSHYRQVVGRGAASTPDDARRAVAAAHDAFPAWRDTEPAERARRLSAVADGLRRRRFELAAWQVYECGKQWREADADVAEAIDFCNYYAQEMLRLAAPQRRDVPGEDNEYFYEPRGVSVVIAPWNFPLAIMCGMSAAALVTGNTIIMKPAEPSTVQAAKLMEVFQEAGLPAGVVNFLPGAGAVVGPVLTQHPDVALIAFTGSQNVGLMINRQAAETPAGQDHVKRVIAEMGGKNAIIVDEDADLDEAVHGVVASAFGYQGQKCSACSRVVVLEANAEVFLNRLIEATRSLKVAPADDPGCGVGPLIDQDARRRVLGFIEQGKREARLVYAGDVGALADEGFYVAPHIFADVEPTATIAQDEIFGPILAVMKVRNMDEALKIANGTRYALTGGLYSRSPRNIARARREFRVGNLYINRKITGALVDRQPFGGFKLSGIGSKAGGPDYLLQFVVPRTITENTLRRGFAPALATVATPTTGREPK
jgi:RHH-type proline utilization regulon transcriptional repressor/proline dehydrogenase/delta 1-pyrroline-5-carboxylate dehydrogenase